MKTIKKIISSIFFVLIWTSAVHATTDATVAETKQYIIDKSNSCGKTYVREYVAEGRYITVDTEIKIEFDNNQMLIGGISHAQRLTGNDEIYYEANSSSLTKVDLPLLSTENTQSENKVYLKCNQEDVLSPKRCFKTKKDSSHEYFFKDQSVNVKDIKSTSRTLVLAFCNPDTAKRMKNAINILAIKSGEKIVFSKK
jgi:hypothetical protein